MTRTGAPVRACKPQSTASMRRAGAAQSQAVELYSPATSEYVVTPVGHSVLRIHIVSRALRRRNAVEDAGHLYRASAHARTNQAADGRSSSSALLPARSSRGGFFPAVFACGSSPPCSSCLWLLFLSSCPFRRVNFHAMAAPSPDAVGRVVAATVGLLGGGAVGFYLQKKLMDDERAARAVRIKARLERLREMEAAAHAQSTER